MSRLISDIRKQKQESLIFKLRASVAGLRRRGIAGRAILFGSYARGTWSGASDVDVLFVCGTDEDRRIITRTMMDFGVPIDLVFRTHQQFDSKDPFMDAIKKEGVDLG